MHWIIMEQLYLLKPNLGYCSYLLTLALFETQLLSQDIISAQRDYPTAALGYKVGKVVCKHLSFYDAGLDLQRVF